MYSKSVWARYIYQIKWQLGFFWPTLSSRKSQLPEVVLQKDKFWAVKMKVQQGARLPQSAAQNSTISSLNQSTAMPPWNQALEIRIAQASNLRWERGNGRQAGRPGTNQFTTWQSQSAAWSIHERARPVVKWWYTTRTEEEAGWRGRRGDGGVGEEYWLGALLAEDAELLGGEDGAPLLFAPLLAAAPGRHRRGRGGSRGVGHGMPGPGAIRRRNETRGGGRQCGAVRTWWGAATATLLSADCTRPDFRFCFTSLFFYVLALPAPKKKNDTLEA